MTAKDKAGYTENDHKYHGDAEQAVVEIEYGAVRHLLSGCFQILKIPDRCGGSDGASDHLVYRQKSTVA